MHEEEETPRECRCCICRALAKAVLVSRDELDRLANVLFATSYLLMCHKDPEAAAQLAGVAREVKELIAC